jgi:hypothetical protein
MQKRFNVSTQTHKFSFPVPSSWFQIPLLQQKSLVADGESRMTLRSFSRLLPGMATRGKRLRERHQAAAAKIKENDFVEEFSTDLSRMAMLSAPSLLFS